MAPQANHKSPLDSPNTTKSKYWSDSVHEQSNLPWPKKQCGDRVSSGHEPAQTSLRPLPAEASGAPNKQQYKRKFEDAFDFRPKDATSVKEEPQEDGTTTKTATLTRHFAASKSGQATTAPKTTLLTSKPNKPTGSSTATTGDLRERSAIVTTLAFVHDGAVTEAAIALVLRWAHDLASSGNGDVYNTAFIRSILADLDIHGVDPDRRVVVTQMLARPLQQQLESLRSSSESLRSCLESINTPQPSSPLSRNSRQAE